MNGAVSVQDPYAPPPATTPPGTPIGPFGPQGLGQLTRGGILLSALGALIAAFAPVGDIVEGPGRFGFGTTVQEASIAITVIALIVLAVAAVRLFRGARAAQRRIEPPANALVAAADEAQGRIDLLNQHNEDLSKTTAELSTQVAVLRELGIAGRDAVQAIRSPLRLLGR